MWDALGTLILSIINLFIEDAKKPKQARDVSHNADASKRWSDRVRRFKSRIRS